MDVKIFFGAIVLIIWSGSSEGQISVSGISSGGYAAVQFHVIFSSHLDGCGVIAGGPFWCANANVAIALTSCMVQPQLFSVNELIAATAYAEAMFSIDPTSNLDGQNIWLFSGTLDTVVDPGVVKKLESYYSYYTDQSNIQTVYTIAAEHCYPTNDYGNTCKYLGEPFINNCGYDAAGKILQQIWGKLSAPVQANNSQIQMIYQEDFIPAPYTGITAGLQNKAYYYLPKQCAQGKNCKLHIAFHGCKQTVDDIDDIFYTSVGYNEWAESNNIIVLYPQAMANTLNPEGCWDWWGYTGVDYCTYYAPQMATVKNMMDYLVQIYNVAY